MNGTQSIRVVIVDDHPLVRSGLAVFLSSKSGIVLVGKAENGEEAIEQCALTHPDVVILDLFLPGMDGVMVTEFIRKQNPQTQVLILTGFEDNERLEKAKRAGAAGCLLKTATGEQIVQAIRAAHTCSSRLACEITEKPKQQNSDQIDPTCLLSTRELQVLNLMIKGMNNPQIAYHLHVSTATAKFHVSSILAKFKVTSRTEAVALVVRTQLIESAAENKNGLFSLD